MDGKRSWTLCSCLFEVAIVLELLIDSGLGCRETSENPCKSVVDHGKPLSTIAVINVINS